jgi:hypothetical protein
VNGGGINDVNVIEMTREETNWNLLSDSRNCTVAHAQDADVNGRHYLVQLNNCRMLKKDSMQ